MFSVFLLTCSGSESNNNNKKSPALAEQILIQVLAIRKREYKATKSKT